MTDLLAHIEAMNAETQKWVDAAPDRWAGLFHTDMDHWAEGGIHTVEDFNNMLDAEHEREMRKAAMYSQYDDHYDTDWNNDRYGDISYEDKYCAAVDAEYDDYNDFDEWCASQADEDDNAYEEWYAEKEMKKYGVDTIIMIPTHYEFMANQAGFLEY